MEYRSRGKEKLDDNDESDTANNGRPSGEEPGLLAVGVGSEEVPSSGAGTDGIGGC